MTKSAAQRAAELLERSMLSNDCDEVASALLREDRQRRQMERAILKWADDGPFCNGPLWKIAVRLRKETK